VGDGDHHPTRQCANGRDCVVAVGVVRKANELAIASVAKQSRTDGAG
jgi:hypothetical protein